MVRTRGQDGRSRIPKILSTYNPVGKKDSGKPQKRWKDQF